MLQKLTRWLIFSVLLALVPIAVSCVVQVAHGKELRISPALAHGELLLITASLCAASCGELFGTAPRYALGKIIAGGLSVLILVLATLLFSEVVSAWASGVPLVESITARTSMVLFCTSVVACGSCIALAER
jgi:hypothetical protein